MRKVWRQLLREGIRVARCTVARLMAVMGLAGVLRGKKVRTTISRKAVAAGDRVNRQFVAERPDQLWVADFTYVSTWRGFVYVAFIIDVFAGYIVGWRVTVTDAVFAVPAYGPQNDVTLKMPAFEWVHVQLHQQKGMISLSPPTICNSAPESMAT